MFKKPGLLAAFGIGYVLGARAGRERYDAMVTKAQELWHDPRVQEKAHRAGFMAKEKAGAARDSVQHKMPGGTTPSETPSETPTPTPTPHAAPSATRPGMAGDPVTDMPRGWES